MNQKHNIITNYLDALERGEMDRAASFFSENARYSHPPYGDEPVDSQRHEVVGRVAIRGLFERRGHRPTRHELQSVVSDGQHIHLSGVARNEIGELLGSFTAVAMLDAATGEISEYASYVSVPAVWATLDA